jgi:heat shock protein HslJ
MSFLSQLASLVVTAGGLVANRADRKTSAITFAVGFVILGVLVVTLTQKPSPSHPQSVSVSSTYWRLAEWARQPSTLARPISVNFGRGESLSGRSACNDFVGTYTRIGWIFVVRAEILAARTCDPSLMDVDKSFVADLRRATQLSIDEEGRLNALDDTGAVVFRFRRARSAYGD